MWRKVLGSILASAVTRVAWVAGLLMSLSGCGADTNLLGLTVPDTHKDTFEARLAAGRAAYDRGDLDEARKHAEKAYAMNPASERASLLYAFVHLALAGTDPFSLARAIRDADDAKKKKKSLTEEQSGTSDLLMEFQTAVGITSKELLELGDLDSSDPEIPLLVPRCVETVRGGVERLRHLNLAILAVCPFVDSDVKISLDYRQRCEATDVPREQPHKAHFLWAFAHLTEALLFNAVLTYRTVDPVKTNLELKAIRLKEQEIAGADGMEGFLSSIESFERTVSQVLPVRGSCSDEAPTTMLYATLNDLGAVDAAFKMIPKIPQKITRVLQTNLERLKTSGRGNPTQALKGDMTKKVSVELAAKIDALEEESGESLSAEQRASLCSSFDSISGGNADLRPALCAGK